MGRIGGVFAKGATIDVEVEFRAFHKGRLEFRLCRFEKGDHATWEDAERAALTWHAVTNQIDCVSIKTVASVDTVPLPADGSSTAWHQAWWYVPVDGNRGTYTTTATLPADVTCDGVTAKCVLHMHYLTSNSCIPPDTPAEYHHANMAICGSTLKAYPEEFWVGVNAAVRRYGFIYGENSCMI